MKWNKDVEIKQKLVLAFKRGWHTEFINSFFGMKNRSGVDFMRWNNKVTDKCNNVQAEEFVSRATFGCRDQAHYRLFTVCSVVRTDLLLKCRKT